MIKLSFILPCYNVAPYVGRCIESIEHQDLPREEYEVICVDDCSKDNTADVIRKYQKQYSNIRLICHEVNKTAGGARNTGVDAAQGEYLGCVDPDDAIVENVLENLTKEIERLKVDILFFNYNYINEEGGAHVVLQFNRKYEILSGQDFFLTYSKKKHLAEVTSIWHEVFLASYLKNNHIRYPEIKSSQDVVFVWHAFIKAQRVTAISNVAYNHHRRSSSTTGSRGKYKAINVISAPLLYVSKLMELNANTEMKQVYHEDLLFACKVSMNDDSRKVLMMSLNEQRIFYKELQKYKDLIIQTQSLMNRKTKVIFNYKLPYILWQLMMWLYMTKDGVKKVFG